MRILVVSDTHRNKRALERAVLSQPKAELILFLGDGVGEAEEVSRDLRPNQTMLMVKGNNDWCCREPLEREVWAGDTKILMMHGHSRQVTYGMGSAIQAAKNCGAKILLFGHTHIPVCDYVDGLYIMNPGSLGIPLNGFPTYGVIDILPQGILPAIIQQQR